MRDPLFGNKPVDMDLPALLGKPPRMTRDVRRQRPQLRPFSAEGIDLPEAVRRVLLHPTVADKTFLVTIGDRTVGGLCSRDPMVGPWQVPVADCATTLLAFEGYAGEAFAVGERGPIAVVDGPASGRMAVGEALTNLAAAPVASLSRVKLSANWMAAAGSPGEDAALFDTVRAVALDLCPRLGIGIPVGKDSMSMRTTWEEHGLKKAVVSPLSLVVSAFAPCDDVRATWTPQLRTDRGATDLVFVDLAGGRRRLGGSILAQVFGQTGNEAPDVDEPERTPGPLRGPRRAARGRARPRLPRPVGRRALRHPGRDGVRRAHRPERRPRRASSAPRPTPATSWPPSSTRSWASCCSAAPPTGRASWTSSPVTASRASSSALRTRRTSCGSPAAPARSWRSRARRSSGCGPRRPSGCRRCATTPSPPARSTTASSTRATPASRPPSPSTPPRTWPRRSSLAAPGPAWPSCASRASTARSRWPRPSTAPGFESIDVHMSDVIAGRVSLSDFKGFAACGGFSYGDVLGGGEGWAKSILFNPRARDEFAAFFGREDAFALGVCNGCQMMSALHELIPGTEAWPRFVKNRSEQFEARLVLVEIPKSPSFFFDGMAGSRIPVVTAHGEGRALFTRGQSPERGDRGDALRGQPRRRDRELPVQRQRLAARDHRRHHRRRPLHDRDAAPGARLPHGPDVLAPRRLGRGQPLDAPLPQRRVRVG